LVGPALLNIPNLEEDLVDWGRSNEEDRGVVRRDDWMGDDADEVLLVLTKGNVLGETIQGADGIISAEQDELVVVSDDGL